MQKKLQQKNRRPCLLLCRGTKKGGEKRMGLRVKEEGGKKKKGELRILLFLPSWEKDEKAIRTQQEEGGGKRGFDLPVTVTTGKKKKKKKTRRLGRKGKKGNKRKTFTVSPPLDRIGKGGKKNERAKKGKKRGERGFFYKLKDGAGPGGNQKKESVLGRLLLFGKGEKIEKIVEEKKEGGKCSALGARCCKKNQGGAAAEKEKSPTLERRKKKKRSRRRGGRRKRGKKRDSLCRQRGRLGREKETTLARKGFPLT